MSYNQEMRKQAAGTVSIIFAGMYFGLYFFCNLFWPALAMAAAPAPIPTPVRTPAPPISYFHTFTKDISLGAAGAEVKALQQFLNMEGFPIAKSGPGSKGNETAYFGTSTQSALKALQKTYALSVTGRVDSALRSSINAPQTNARIIASSSAAVFGFPHGTMVLGKAVVIGTVRENPAHILIFPDPNDVSHFLSTTTPGYIDLASVAYDPAVNKLYFVATKTDTQHLAILSVDPKTLEWTQVFEFTGHTFVGYSTIRTDGTYAYVATQSYPAYLLKIRISDWSLSILKPMPEVLGGFHSSVLHMYPDRGEWYVTNYAPLTRFYKVNTEDLSVTSIVLSRNANITNDVYFRPVNNQGGYMYLPSETNGGLEVVNTATMTSRHYTTPTSYGVFSDGKDLISVDPVDHEIIKYRGYLISKPLIIKLPEPYILNEWFPAPYSGGYFTTFVATSSLYRYLEK
jgi:peptidoglycan hydrolase-like protein with peptidoglycan-binding domain